MHGAMNTIKCLSSHGCIERHFILTHQLANFLTLISNLHKSLLTFQMQAGIRPQTNTQFLHVAFIHHDVGKAYATIAILSVSIKAFTQHKLQPTVVDHVDVVLYITHAMYVIMF